VKPTPRAEEREEDIEVVRIYFVVVKILLFR
jgi:hypothetical protein